MQGNPNEANSTKSKYSFLQKKDNFDLTKYYNNFTENSNSKKIPEKEIKKTQIIPHINNIRNDSIPENFNKMFYPSDKKIFRDYQFNIVKSCLLENTLVCLPTGMGKTFIASIIMYNFNLWFNGKIFFFAPTKPLVNQQKNSFIHLFENLNYLVCEITGSSSSKNRLEYYTEKKIFFMTPQTFENDLKKNIFDPNTISLLIFDEAHRAQKKYAYANIVNLLDGTNPYNSSRIVALSASPGSNVQNIQNIFHNLKLKKIELRTENDLDLKEYLFNKSIQLVEVDSSDEINKFSDMIIGLINNRLEVLKRFKIIPIGESAKFLGTGHFLKYQNQLKLKKEEFLNEIGPNMMKEVYVIFSLIFRLLNAKKILLTQGLESFKELIKKLENFDIGEKKNYRKIPNNWFNNHSNNLKKNNFYLENKRNNFQTPLKNAPNFDKINQGNIAKINSFLSPISVAKNRLIESEEFQKLKKELFENSAHQENNIEKQNKIYGIPEKKIENFHKTQKDICIEIEVDDYELFNNPEYKNFNNLKKNFKKNLEETIFSDFSSDEKKPEKNPKRFSIITEIHPKLKKLQDVLLENLHIFSKNSKAIIFTQYINTAEEIKNFLNKNSEFSKNDINFEVLKGQKKDFNQKDQAEVLRNFKDGIINVLIGTCVAEEGLDIEDVDLIICYDITTSSPIKMIQRFGRTGRKKDGKVIVLCCKGEEKSKYFRSIRRLKNIQKDLKSLKFDFESSRRDIYTGYNNILYINPQVIEICEYFELEEDIIDRTEEDFLSETTEIYEEEGCDEDLINLEDEKVESLKEKNNADFSDLKEFNGYIQNKKGYGLIEKVNGEINKINKLCEKDLYDEILDIREIENKKDFYFKEGDSNSIINKKFGEEFNSVGGNSIKEDIVNIKFKIFKRKSTDGKRFMTSSDIEGDCLNQDNSVFVDNNNNGRNIEGGKSKENFDNSIIKNNSIINKNERKSNTNKNFDFFKKPKNNILNNSSNINNHKKDLKEKNTNNQMAINSFFINKNISNNNIVSYNINPFTQNPLEFKKNQLENIPTNENLENNKNSSDITLDADLIMEIEQVILKDEEMDEKEKALLNEKKFHLEQENLCNLQEIQNKNINIPIETFNEFDLLCIDLTNIEAEVKNQNLLKNKTISDESILNLISENITFSEESILKIIAQNRTISDESILKVISVNKSFFELNKKENSEKIIDKNIIEKEEKIILEKFSKQNSYFHNIIDFGNETNNLNLLKEENLNSNLEDNIEKIKENAINLTDIINNHIVHTDEFKNVYQNNSEKNNNLDINFNRNTKILNLENKKSIEIKNNYINREVKQISLKTFITEFSQVKKNSQNIKDKENKENSFLLINQQKNNLSTPLNKQENNDYNTDDIKSDLILLENKQEINMLQNSIYKSQISSFTKIKNIDQNLRDMLYFHNSLNVLKENNFNNNSDKKDKYFNNQNLPVISEVKQNENKKILKKKIINNHDFVFEKNIQDTIKIGSKRKHSDFLSTTKKFDNLFSESKKIENYFPLKKFHN